jgi:hypothetical protein
LINNLVPIRGDRQCKRFFFYWNLKQGIMWTKPVRNRTILLVCVSDSCSCVTEENAKKKTLSVPAWNHGGKKPRTLWEIYRITPDWDVMFIYPPTAFQVTC